MNVNYNIRKAVINDIEDIYTIEIESFPEPWNLLNLISEFNAKNLFCIVAEIENEIAAYSASRMIIDEIHLNKIAVLEKYRREGIASAMINYICGKLKPEGAEKILLEVREKNRGARDFYKKLKFQEVGFRKNYYANDNAVLIEKII